MKLKILILLFLSQFSFAQNSLEPVTSTFDLTNYRNDYYQNIRFYLIHDLYEYPEIRMVVFPSFHKEYVFQIEKDSLTKENYLITIKEPEEGSVWVMTENPHLSFKLKIKTYKSSIKNDDVDLLYNLLYSAIIKTKFRKDNGGGTDGTTYHLSVSDNGLKSAKIWSPQNPNLKELILIM